MCDIPIQKLFVIGCTARGSRTVAWCMVREHCRRGYVAELSSEWATDTRSILDAVLYPKVSKTLRNVGKYSPNETASHRSGLLVRNSAERTSNVARVGLRVTGACVRACVQFCQHNVRLQCKLLLSLSHSQTEKWNAMKCPSLLGTLSKCDKSKRCLQTAVSDRRFIGVQLVSLLS